MKLDGLGTERVVALAPEIERAGLDEVWVCEDLGRNGGIAQAALVLAATERCRVGLGIAPAAVRNVAYLAMEIASLCRVHPGRFIPGVGHGMPDWLRQVGAHPGKLLPCLEEVTIAAQRLIAGETVSFHGEYVQIDDVTLDYPAPQPPRLHLGVRGPRGIEIAARVAGGVILAEGSSPRYVRGVRDRMGDARITAFAWFSVDDDSEAAIDRLRPQVDKALGEDFMRAQLGDLASEVSTDSVIRELTVSGTPGDCAAAIERLYDAGADSVVLQPLPGTEANQLEQLRALPTLSGRDSREA